MKIHHLYIQKFSISQLRNKLEEQTIKITNERLKKNVKYIFYFNWKLEPRNVEFLEQEICNRLRYLRMFASNSVNQTNHIGLDYNSSGFNSTMPHTFNAQITDNIFMLSSVSILSISRAYLYNRDNRNFLFLSAKKRKIIFINSLDKCVKLVRNLMSKQLCYHIIFITLKISSHWN